MVVVLFGEFEEELHGFFFAGLFKAISMKIGLKSCNVGEIVDNEEDDEEFSEILVNSIFFSTFFSFFWSSNAGCAELAGLAEVGWTVSLLLLNKPVG